MYDTGIEYDMVVSTATPTYQPPRQAGAGRPLHEPVADLPRTPRRPNRGLAVPSANRTGGATDSAAVAASFATAIRVVPRQSRIQTADDIVNATQPGILTEQVCQASVDDTVLSLTIE